MVAVVLVQVMAAVVLVVAVVVVTDTHLSEHEPHIRAAVLPKALVVKAVDLRDLARLVVATDQPHTLRVPHL